MLKRPLGFWSILAQPAAGWALCFSAVVLGMAGMVSAQEPAVAVAPPASHPVGKSSATHAKASAVAGRGNASRPLTHPTWKELAPQQRDALQPLKADWDLLDDIRKRKWLTMADNYQRLAPSEQAKLQQRMTEWASLSAKERSAARLNFAETKELTPEQKEERWQAYQALSSEEKRSLAREATKTMPGVVGAAAAVKPVPASKLALPAPVQPQASGPVLPVRPVMAPVLAPASAPRVNAHTLLPKRSPASHAASAPVATPAPVPAGIGG